MVARVGRVDRDDRDMGQILALTERQRRDALGLFDHAVGEDVRDAVLVDRDKAEAAGREGVAEDVGRRAR